jgi:hypothetical protein
MTDSVRAAREDLAFLKAVADDRGPLPALLGAHLLALGCCYGANLVYIWAARAGYVPWPEAWMNVAWIPGTIPYIPWVLVLTVRGRGEVLGPTARVFGAAWVAMALMTFTIVLVMMTAAARTGRSFHEVWPPIAFALYGGSWTVIGLIRRRLPDILIACGCFVTAIVSASVITRPELWLVLGLGLLLFIAAPGAAIVRQARAAD